MSYLSFFPTPILKTSPIPIKFIPFNNGENECNHCGNAYSTTVLFGQSYCKNCLLRYVKNVNTTDNTYLDVSIGATNQCVRHEIARNTDFHSGNIQEWCEYCSEVLHFNQIVTTDDGYCYVTNVKQRIIFENGKHCKLCGKLVYQERYKRDNNIYKFELCSNCYKIPSGWIESTLTKKLVPILYLPWWDAKSKCIACEHSLNFISGCQKWCSRCIIVYTGCRYCLITNVIFGITTHLQCKKCKRTLFIELKIDITTICSGNEDVDEFLGYAKYNQIADYETNLNKNSNSLNVYGFVRYLTPPFKWYPYSEITNLEKIAEGGFGVVYKATLNDRLTVAMKKFLNSQNINKYFLNELYSNYQCRDDRHIIRCFGITQDPETKDFMIMMEFADRGDLHKYLQNNFTNIMWNEKLDIVRHVSYGLEFIHKRNLIHRDFHSGNIVSICFWSVCDLGLSQSVDKTSSNNEIYGVIPYVAPEIFKGATFSKESDIYSLGMIMWELTTGCKPFANVEHDIDLIYKIIDGKRPEITNDTPECFARLMKRCWNADPLKRPTANEIQKTVNDWGRSCDHYNTYHENKIIVEQFKKAEIRRVDLIQSKKLGPEFSENPHPKAIFTSRMLTPFISKSSSNNSTSTVSSNARREYITKENELDINDIQRQNTDSAISSNAQHPNAIYTSRPLSEMISTVKNSRKRNNEELEIEFQKNDSNKRVKLEFQN